ncbi:putative transmembrane emp24 domain-containing protein [Helianthus annuus]|nr:putative transmembrane emp24 domain-containing protein [Helianthus annuus]KAJ0564153.1 putative transmembrane emp24 domain-containing protein [Helianthus annuus]KAJ0729483.1 putative transmembrane emp24 domain-containing protein [Helianthus annuus]
MRRSINIPTLIIVTVIILILLTSSPLVIGMRFDLETGATKCITEDIKINAMTVGKYSIVKPVEGFPLSEYDRITVRVICLNKLFDDYIH